MATTPTLIPTHLPNKKSNSLFLDHFINITTTNTNKTIPIFSTLLHDCIIHSTLSTNTKSKFHQIMKNPLKSLSWFSQSLRLLHLPLLFLLILIGFASGFGSIGPISAAFGENGFFCAIDASGKQAVICWGKNSTSSSSSNPLVDSITVPPMAALAGGYEFMCGILANTSQAYCWNATGSSSDLVPPIFKTTSYSHISAGKNHVCAIRGSYYSDNDLGTIDCWDIVLNSDNTLTSKQSTLFYSPLISSLVFKYVVSGDGFSCASIREGGVVCWGPNSANLGVFGVSENFISLSSSTESFCGISQVSNEIKCWGSRNSSLNPPYGTGFVSVAAGSNHFCGIREDNHGIECWGVFSSSSIPKGSGFYAIASSDFTTCGIREDDMVLDCWFANVSSPSDYDPPLQLCSPGLCTSRSCGDGKFTFNASLLHEPDLSTLCVRKDLKICSPCGFNCSEGFFPSSPCNENADRVCTSCSLCQNSSCSNVCQMRDLQSKQVRKTSRLVLILGSSLSGLLLILMGWCLLPRLVTKKIRRKKNLDVENRTKTDLDPPILGVPCPGMAENFRLTELKDATNGFKEFNELGRGRYGFVYKAHLTDGRQVAVKRANAATIISTNSRDFEAELEILCHIRHTNIVNLLGYCTEMGERLLVYEYMPNGTLYDHLHGGLNPLNWTLRLKISMQAAKGLLYLHKEVVPPIVHRNIKSSNILLDSDWRVKIADFSLLTHNNTTDADVDTSGDVYSFGIVLLEILSGKKGYDRDSDPPNLVEWALPLIRQGKAAAVFDRYVTLPRNVEPLLKLADIAELAVRENANERPNMADLTFLLEQLAKDGLIL